jgi:tetratricopeptide (TPR) repeat protein
VLRLLEVWGKWDLLRRPSGQGPSLRGAAADLATAAAGIAEVFTSQEDARPLLEAAWDSAGLRGEMRLFVGHRLGRLLNQLGNSQAARPYLEQVAQHSQRFADLAQGDLAEGSLWRGHLRTALAESEPCDEARRADIKGQVLLLNGRFTEAVAEFRHRLELADRSASIVARAVARWRVLDALSWQSPEDAWARLPDASEAFEQANLAAGQCHLAASAAVAAVGRQTDGEVEELLARSRHWQERSGSRVAAHSPLLAEVFFSCATGAVRRALAAREALLALNADTRADPYYLAIANVWVEDALHEPPTGSPKVEWMDEWAQVATRWANVIRGRRRR